MQRWMKQAFALALLIIVFVAYQNCLSAGGDGAKGGSTPDASPSGVSNPETQSKSLYHRCGQEILNSIGSSVVVSNTANSAPWISDQLGLESTKLAECRMAMLNQVVNYCQNNPTAFVNFVSKFQHKDDPNISPTEIETMTMDACHLEMPTGTCTNIGGALSGTSCTTNSQCCNNDCVVSGTTGVCTGPTPMPVDGCKGSGVTCTSTGECCSSLTCKGDTNGRACAPSVVNQKLKVNVALVDGIDPGFVNSTPNGIFLCSSNRPQNCTGSFSDNSNVDLNASATSGYAFVHWTGDCSGTSSTTSVLMDSYKECTANYRLIPTFKLTVTVSGSGGFVGSNPSGITVSSGWTDDGNFAENSDVILIATAATGYGLVSWSGDCTGTDSTTTINMGSNKNCTATFQQTHHYISSTVTGNGTLTTTPFGINCSPVCSAMFLKDSNVTMTANPQLGYQANWSADCASTQTLNMTSNKTCNVSFTKIQHTLGVTVSPSSSGTVTSTPIGISCGFLGFGPCANFFDYGQSVSLSNSPKSGWTFKRWSGSGCSSNVSMTSNRSCTIEYCANQNTSCLSSSECCSSGNRCVGGTCKPCSSFGITCFSSTDCCSNLCNFSTNKCN